MRIEELVNQNYNSLNENDLMIWNYIVNNKSKCCNISIEELSKECNISRATISRFTQKIYFDGFREFKMRLKLECEQDEVKSEILVENIVQGYHKSLDLIDNTNLDEVFDKIHRAKRLFVFGTGEVQNAAAKMIKRMFLNAKIFFVTLYGENELKMAIENMCENDFFIIISLSGENSLAIEAMKTLKSKDVYLVSITRLSDNTIARYANKNLYIIPNTLMRIGDTSFDACGSYFNIVEILCARYIIYMQKNHISF